MKKLFNTVVSCLLMVGFTNAQILPTTGKIMNDTMLVNKSQISRTSLITRSYVPYTLSDIKGVKMPVIKNPDGTSSTMTSTEYLNRLNAMEKELNSKGYSLRTRQVSTATSRYTVNYGGVKNLRQSSSALTSLSLKPTVQYPTEAVMLSKVTGSAMATTVYTDGSAAPASTTPCRPALMNYPTAAKTASYSLVPLDLSFGDKSSLYAGIFAKYTLYGKAEPLNNLCYWTATPASVTAAIKNTQSEFSFFAGTGAHIFILNREFKLAEASISISTPSDPAKKMSKKILVMRVGKTIAENVEEYSEDSKLLDRTDSDSFDLKLADLVIPVAGPVSVRTIFKVKGSVGIRYLTSLNRYGFYAAVVPFAKSSASFEGAIDVGGIASAGVGGNVTLFDLQAPASVKSMLTWGPESWKLENVTDWTLKASFLKGKLYAFVELDYIIDTKRWQVDFANLNGLEYTKNLININNTVSFPSWKKELSIKL